MQTPEKQTGSGIQTSNPDSERDARGYDWAIEPPIIIIIIIN